MMEGDNNYSCFSEKWNMKGNTQDFLLAEKTYQNAYAELLSGLEPFLRESGEERTFPFNENEGRIVPWLNQEIRDIEQFGLVVKRATDVIAVVKRIVVQTNRVEKEILDRLSTTIPEKNVMSLVCFHSAINNVCEFVHLHRLSEKYRAAAVLVGEANKQLGIGTIHYIKMLLALINLAKKDWIKAGTVEVAKVIGKNMRGCAPLYACEVLIEECIGLAELAYRDSASTSVYPIRPVKLQINGNYKLYGRFDLPLNMGGYLAYCKYCNMYIVGFRGTDNWENWLTNISQHLVGVSLIYKVALGLVVKMKKKYGRRLMVVGHSLGGGLAQFAVAGLNDDYAVGLGYNSAGLSNMAADMMKDKYQWNIFHLHLRHDQVFYIGNQLGRSYDQNEYVLNPLIAHKLESMRNIASITASIANFRLRK